MDIRRAIRNALGGGNDVTMLNPLPVTFTPHAGICIAVTIPAGTTYYVPSGDVWGVLALVIEAGAELRIDGEVHCWDDVTGPGIITGEGELRLH
ncbi:hypothetical protein ES703_16987 [subsurface metagenome]